MKALLVIDMIADFINEDGSLYIGTAAKELVPAVKAKLDEFRSSGDMVIFICDRHLEDDSEFEIFPPHGLENSGGDEIVDELAPNPNERIIYKRRFSSFFGTDLDLTLREKKITSVELVGCVTNICILYTAADARMLNYNVSVSEKAVASFDQEAHHFALQEMEKSLGIKLI